MSVPKVGVEALQEAQEKIAKISRMEDVEQIKAEILKFHEDFKKKQPEFHNWVSEIVEHHLEYTDGVLTVNQLATYIMLITSSLYIQDEMDDIAKLFKFNDKKDNPGQDKE